MTFVPQQVSALDPDLPPSVHQNILYYLSPDEQRNFTIDSRSGQLSIRGCLDREAAIRGTMTLYPRANDEGGKGHDADPATVHVTILDLNDNYPHIIKPRFRAGVLCQTWVHVLDKLLIAWHQKRDTHTHPSSWPVEVWAAEDAAGNTRKLQN
ncbi:protocadherin-11 X-linked-like [Eriocheir sinensis]|uniref:protocadherin-11 X-linked-like n=1 Tax=Eriocheir sinensis TaxID=95602 RepID=UPI0021C72064|nr:protocadherin-11 X-linked-like [Eriocheir sinensis]XP_050709592.1 protocadherin-11 X-linked-like [Eriocheir sinensis]